jgi:hypothetical protein
VRGKGLLNEIGVIPASVVRPTGHWMRRSNSGHERSQIIVIQTGGMPEGLAGLTTGARSVVFPAE